MRDLLLVLAFGALAVFSAGVVFLLRRRRRMDRIALRRAARLVEPDIVTPPRDPGRELRPGWANPWLWIALSAASVVLGLVWWRGALGGVFLFVPFVWLSRPKPPTVDPRSNGHAKREGPF